MIPAALVRTFIEQIASLRNAEKTKWSATRDVFEARLNDHSRKTRNWLFGAVIGEIGLNTFDHNYNFPEGAPKGLYCDFCHASRYVVLLDFGIGLKASLGRVDGTITDDLSAMKAAFTKQISGRAPEQRGNGLKFVRVSAVKEHYSLYYHSGNAVCHIDGNGYSFEESDYTHKGCFCILEAGGKHDG